MKLWLSSWGTRWNHLLWRLGMIVPILFSQYTYAEDEGYEEQKSNGWIVLLVSLVVLGLSAWSFFL